MAELTGVRAALNALMANELARGQVTGNRTVTARRHPLDDHQIRKRPDAFDRRRLHQAPRRRAIPNRNSAYGFESRPDALRAVRSQVRRAVRWEPA